MMEIDTGQQPTEMDSEGLKDVEQNQKVKDLDENQRINQQDTMCGGAKECQLKAILFTTEIGQDDEKNEIDMKNALQNHVSQCVEQWKQLEIIQGVMNKDNIIMIEGFEDIDAWCYEPRVIKNKKNHIVEAFCSVMTKFSVYDLCETQKERREEQKNRMSSKETGMEHFKRLGFIIGPNVQLAAPGTHVKEINEKVG